MTEILIARTSRRVNVAGVVHTVRRRITTAHPSSAVVQDYPELWEPISVDFPAPLSAEGTGSVLTINLLEVVDEAALLEHVRAAWSEIQGEGPASTPAAGATKEPSPKDVRAWAKDQGLDAPARGKLPDELVARYKAAQAEGG